MKLTDFQKKLAWGFGIIAIISLWIAFPLIFKYWVYKLLVTPPFTTERFASLGPIGDIFGSLTAFFTSLTLVIVIYSAHLQKQANKDARDAMADQLQEARDATANQLIQARQALRQQLEQANKALEAQLKQARDDTEQQIANAKELSDVQLKQSEQTAAQQLSLSESMHNAQMKESKHAIFSNMFNILLNQKNEAQERLNLRLGNKNLQSLFEHLAYFFEEMVSTEWKDFDITNEEHEQIMTAALHFELKEFTEGLTLHDELQSYFYNYCSLISLIKKKEYKEFDSNFFFAILSNLMTQNEQETLLLFCAMTPYIRSKLKGSKLFDAGFSDNMAIFIFRNFDKSLFNHSTILENWRKFEQEESPA